MMHRSFRLTPLKPRAKTIRRTPWYIFFRKPNIFSAFGFSCQVFWEFFTGFLFISRFTKSVSFFGSARESMPERYYTDSEELAARLSMKGFAVVTGGNGGIMRSANRGCARAHGDSVGVSIVLPREKNVNSFLTHKKDFHYFFSRKTILSCGSEVYVYFPGGYGTLDEFFEMVTLIQTGRSEFVPIVLYGKSFWEPIISFVQEKLIKEFKTVSADEGEKFFHVVDSVNEAEYYINSLNVTNSRTCKINVGDLRV